MKVKQLYCEWYYTVNNLGPRKKTQIHMEVYESEGNIKTIQTLC